MKTSDTVSAIASALVKAQAVMHGAAKDGVNPQFKSSTSGGKYATLAAVIDACRKPLTDHGIAFLQAPGAILPEGVPITTTLVHTSGEWIANTLVMPVDKRTAQGVGSAITYGCRYALMAMVGLPPVDDDDDDGNAATEQTYGWKEQRPSPPQVPSPPVPAKNPDPPSPTDPAHRIIAFIKESLLSVTGQRSLVEWELNQSALFDSLSPEGKAEIEQAKKDRIAELKRRAA
jgi:hypothetical protein